MSQRAFTLAEPKHSKVPTQVGIHLQHAFTLVELSIVLVILGLLVGGVLAGQSLIRAAEMRAVTTEHQRYTAAVYAFRDKYFALPGDMTNAESFWGTVNATDATCRDTASTTTATCNGDGDGNIRYQLSRTREIFAMWKHLSNAGLIEGNYTGTMANSLAWGISIGGNVPRSKISNTGWSVISRYDAINVGGWYSNIFQPNNSHALEFGTIDSTNNALTATPALKPEEAWNIDTKGDDGKPGTGNITTFNTSVNTNCASSSTASSATYQLSYTSAACTLFMGF